MKIVDLSMTITNHPSDPNVRSIERWTHESGPGRLGKVMESFIATVAAREGISPVPVLDEAAFPDGVFMSNEVVSLTVHGGTHVDAPFHYGPRSEGKPARTIEDIPLEWTCGPGIKLSFLELGALEVVTAEHVDRELGRIDRELQPLDIVLIETGWSSRWPNQEYFTEHPAMSPAAIEVLVNRGVKLIGTDTFGFDLPTHTMVERFVKTGDSSHLWPCHMFGRTREYLQIERMAGLSGLRPTGFTLYCPPVRVEGAGAGWARPVAVVEGS